MKNLNSVVRPSFTAKALASLLVCVLPALAQATAPVTAPVTAPLTAAPRTGKLLADYTPFPAARPLPLRACAVPTLTGQGTSSQTTIDCPGAAINWRIDNHLVRVTLRSGGRRSSLSLTDGGDRGIYAPKAFAADLNGDGRPDYLIEHHIGIERTVMSGSGQSILALSGPSGYRLESFVTMLLSPDAVVRRGKTTYLLSASFIIGTNMKNQTHPYFQFETREIRGQRLIQRPTINIQYTRRPNHLPATIQQDGE